VTRRRWIVNASPLIFLTKIGALNLLRQLADEVAVPMSVVQEVAAGEIGPYDSFPVEIPSWLEVMEDLALPPEIAGWDLGAGESQVLAHTLISGDEAVLDDLQGRRCARALGVVTTGTLGVILRAKKQKLVPAARPLVQELILKGLYLSKDLAEVALQEVGE
jgi:predicted nucleic acid-binding protein